MEPQLTVGQAAAQIGVSRELLLSWERRHGIPSPARMPDGSRRYPAALVDALTIVPERRRSGVPLPMALAEAAASCESAPVSSDSLPELVYRDVLDQLELAVTIMFGPRYIVEFANTAHRRMYPGIDIVGRPALEAFTHSRYYDLAYVLNHVRSTGEPLTWRDTLVPHYGIDHWWDFTYARLPLTADGPVRLILTARDVTTDLQARRQADGELQDALRTIERLQRDASSFHTLARVTQLVADGADETDSDLLRLLMRGLNATSISTCLLRGGAWHSTACVGGDHWLLPGHGMHELPLSARDLIEQADAAGVAVGRAAREMNPDAAADDDGIIAIPIKRAAGPESLILAARPYPKGFAEATKLAQTFATIVKMARSHVSGR
jgi:hypothetical protein